jgi:hypothetical protein
VGRFSRADMAIPHSSPVLEKRERSVQLAGLWVSKLAGHNVTPCWPEWLPGRRNYTAEDTVAVFEAMGTVVQTVVQTLTKISSLESSKVALGVLRSWP